MLFAKVRPPGDSASSGKLGLRGKLGGVPDWKKGISVRVFGCAQSLTVPIYG